MSAHAQKRYRHIRQSFHPIPCVSRDYALRARARYIVGVCRLCSRFDYDPLSLRLGMMTGGRSCILFSAGKTLV